MGKQTWWIFGISGGLIGLVIFFMIKPSHHDNTPIERGRTIVEEEGSCRSCHQRDSSFRAPLLSRLVGKQRLLTSGVTVVIDEAYLMRALVQPEAEIAAGYAPTMPNFSSIYDGQNLAAIVAYLKTL